MTKVLIVEDSRALRIVLKELLEDRFPGLQVEEAGSAEAAWGLLETKLPDLIFMDLQLPGESGLQLTRRIKQSYPQVVVAILTSYDLHEYRLAAARIGADHFFCKSTTTYTNLLSLVEAITTGCSKEE